MMTFVRIAAAAGVAALLSMGTASAATIDFSVFPGGSQGTNVLVTPNATFTTTDGIFLNQGGPSNICAFNVAQFSCQEVDMTIDFTSAVSNLSFLASFFNPIDLVTVSIYNGAALLGSVDITGNGIVDLSFFGIITSLFLEDKSTGAGYAYSEFSFDIVDGTVPLPAALPLLAAGLGMMGAVGWRRKRNAIAA